MSAKYFLQIKYAIAQKGDLLNDLVILKGKEVFTDSKVLSNGAGVRHDKLKETIRKHEVQLKKFGRLSTSYGGESTGGRRTEVYEFNEQQATFLITLLKNTDKVIEFKAELVRQFYAMRQLLHEQSTEEWKFFRQKGKVMRLAETDTIKLLAQYAKDRGSKNHGRLYLNYTSLANRTVGIKHISEATVTQLNYLKLIENVFEQIIKSGMEEDKDYHDIFRDCKAKVTQLNNAVTIGATIGKKRKA